MINDIYKTKKQLITELSELRQRVSTLENALEERGTTVETEMIRSFNEAQPQPTIASSQAAMKIANARLSKEARQRSKNLEALARVSSALRQAGTQQEMLPILVKETMEVFQADSGLIYLLDEWAETSSFSLGVDAKVLQSLFTPGKTYWSQVHTEPFWYSTVMDPSYSKNLHQVNKDTVPGTKSVLFVQLRSVQTVIGVLALGFNRIYEPTNTDHQTLLSIAEMGGNALQRSGVMEMLERRIRDRTRELATLYEISVITNQSLNLKDVLENSLQKITTALSGKAATIYQLEKSTNTMVLMAQYGFSEAMESRVQRIPITENTYKWLDKSSGPKMVSSDDYDKFTHDRMPEFSFKVIVPILIQNDTFGVLIVFWEQHQELAVENIGLLTATAERMSTAIHAADLRKLAEKAAVYEERQRLARDLHDSVTQSIYSLTLLAESAKDLARIGDAGRLETRLLELSDGSSQALKEMRLLLYELRQPVPEEADLLTALQRRIENVEHRAGIHAELVAEREIKLPLGFQGELYFIVNEALNNSLKYARASSVTIKLQQIQERILLEVMDNGVGFDPQNSQHMGMGLSTMRERANRLGGKFEIISEANRGASIRVEIPIRENISQGRENGEINPNFNCR